MPTAPASAEDGEDARARPSFARNRVWSLATDDLSVQKGTLLYDAQPFLVGATDYGAYFPGVIDEVAIYDHVLDASRIQAHRAAALP